MVKMEGECCIVTGANSGIGKEITAGLMEEGAHVIMACRSNSKCQTAKEELDARSLPGSCSCSSLDLSSFQSVRDFAARTKTDLSAREENISVLVNNAGVMNAPPDAEGNDMVLVTNHMGPFLLTRLLLPALSATGRIVNVASRAHFQGGSLSIQKGKVVHVPSYWRAWAPGYSKYAMSKLCNVLFTAELQRRLGRSKNPALRSIQAYAGAETVLFASLSQELSGTDAMYLHDCKSLPASAQAADPELASSLWDASEKFVEHSDLLLAG